MIGSLGGAGAEAAGAAGAAAFGAAEAGAPPSTTGASGVGGAALCAGGAAGWVHGAGVGQIPTVAPPQHSMSVAAEPTAAAKAGAGGAAPRTGAVCKSASKPMPNHRHMTMRLLIETSYHSRCAEVCIASLPRNK